MTRVRIPLGIVTGIVFGLFDFKSSVILVNRQLAKERAGFFFFLRFSGKHEAPPPRSEKPREKHGVCSAG